MFLSEEELGELEKYILELVGNDQDKLYQIKKIGLVFGHKSAKY